MKKIIMDIRWYFIKRKYLKKVKGIYADNYKTLSLVSYFIKKGETPSVTHFSDFASAKHLREIKFRQKLKTALHDLLEFVYYPTLFGELARVTLNNSATFYFDSAINTEKSHEDATPFDKASNQPLRSPSTHGWDRSLIAAGPEYPANEGINVLFLKYDVLVLSHPGASGLSVFYPLFQSPTQKERIDAILKIIKTTIDECSETKTKVASTHMIIDNGQYGGLSLESFPISAPILDATTINEYYGDNFDNNIHQKMIKFIDSPDNGLAIFNGDPGTGKTSYIKYLSSLTEKKFIFMPLALIPLLSDPKTVTFFIQKCKGSVLVIEEAEKLVVSREASGNSLISDILNITNGILGDLIQMKVICTFNTQTKNIDKALLRKGRLRLIHEFEPLPPDKVQNLCKKHNLPMIDGPSTLAEIFNQEQVGEVSDLTSRPKVGFKN